MPRYRLRYRGSDLEMPPGEFVVGRSSDCHLALDDALVSRRHAAIHIDRDGAWVEDLGSRNGVRVNQTRIDGRRRLSNLDRITIGSHELVVLELADRVVPDVTCGVCGATVPGSALACARCGALVGRGSPTLVGVTIEMSDVPDTSVPGGAAAATRPIVNAIADKALALGRWAEAERVLERSLQDLLTQAREGRTPPATRLAEGTRYALKLAEDGRRPQWLGWVFELHAATGVLMTAEEIERLHDLVRKLRYRELGPLRRYLEVLRSKGSAHGPAERFLVMRLEGIERILSA